MQPGIALCEAVAGRSVVGLCVLMGGMVDGWLVFWVVVFAYGEHVIISSDGIIAKIWTDALADGECGWPARHHWQR